MLISVALPVPLYKAFDYLPQSRCQKSNHDTSMSTALVKIGSRVRVPFGRRTLIGIVVAHTALTDSDVPVNKLKAIKQVLDVEPIIDGSLLTLAKWLAQYYHYPLGEVLMVMLPSFIRQGRALDIFISHWKIAENASIEDISSTAHRQREQFNLIQLNGEHGASEDVLLMEGVERHYLKKLAEKGLIEHFTQARTPPKKVTLNQLPHSLNTEQQQAVKRIQQSCAEEKYTGFLLNGVTGSGKTEVYLQAMHTVLTSGRQVLVLVPEIGLTPQTKARFSQRFVANILLLHSGLSDSSRMQGWEDCQQGQAQIIIGTRSALLYPFANLGMIIVDEAHDLSYKQQDSLRYYASDVALYRGFQQNITVILGTATPTLEQLKLVNDNKLVELVLSERAGNALPPRLQLVDARQSENPYDTNLVNASSSQHSQTNKRKTRTSYSTQMDGSQQDTGLTPEIIQAIRQTLEAGEQVLIFLNKRGYAPILLCNACGWQADCPNCDSHLTVHKTIHNKTVHNKTTYKTPLSQSLKSSSKTNDNQSPASGMQGHLKCHHCGYQSTIPSHCPDCHSSNLDALGMGTTRLSESLHSIFANPQTSKHPYPIMQIDRDTTRRKGSWQRIYQDINRGNPAILVGTQMIAKGHHFPKVTLVVIPNADRGFLSADFRSPEHTAQMIIQVAGRAGRATRKLEGSGTMGRVLIQTLQPDNRLLVDLVNHGYQAFAQQLLEERRITGLPPFAHACLIRCEGKSLENTHTALQEALKILPKPNQLAVSGVIDAPMNKKNGRYQAQLFVLAQQRNHLHQMLTHWWQAVLALPSAKSVKLTLDVDPLGW